MRRHTSLFWALAALLAGCGDEEIGDPSDAAAARADSAPVTPSSTPPADAAESAPDAAATPDAAPPVDVRMSIPVDARIIDSPAPAPDARAVDAAALPPDAAVVSPDLPAVDPGAMVIGSAGGMLMINEARLFIRPSSLTTNTKIVLRAVGAGYPPLPGRAYSSVISIEPYDQTFTEPVFLTLYHFGGAARVSLYTASPGGAFAPVPNATITGNTAEAALIRFGYFVVAPETVLPDGGPDTRVIPADAAAPDTAVLDLGFESPPQVDLPPPPDAAADVGVDTAPDLPEPKLDTGPAVVFVKVRGEVLSFDPKITRLKPGDTVTWTWETGGIHSVVSGGSGGPGDCASDGKFNSGIKAAGETFSLTFDTPGTYGYHCAAHCSLFEGGFIEVR